MLVLGITILSAWTITALVAGFGLGALIRSADRVQEDQFLEALFSTLAERQTAR